MKKILVIGSFMTDLVFKTSKMPVTGETLIAEKYEKYTGGKGANQAVAPGTIKILLFPSLSIVTFPTPVLDSSSNMID